MIGASFVTTSFFRKGQVNLSTSILLIICALIGSQLGVLVAVNTGEASLSYTLCFIFIVIGILMLIQSIRKNKDKIVDTDPQEPLFKSKWLKWLIISVIGLFIGLMSGIFGAGGGMMIIFVLLVLFQYPAHTAIGTATAIMAILALSGVIGYMFQGYINLEYSIIISLGAVIGGSFGSMFTHKLNEKTLLNFMGLAFIAVGFSTLMLLLFI